MIQRHELELRCRSAGLLLGLYEGVRRQEVAMFFVLKQR